MMSCLGARAVIGEVVGGRATEAERLRLDEHLAGCAPCRLERGRWAAVKRLAERPQAPLGSQARDRILRRLVADHAAPKLVPERRRTLSPIALAFAGVAAMLVAGAALLLRAPTHEPIIAEGTLVRATTAGEVALPGAHLWFPTGAALRLQPARREIQLLAGVVEVEVTPGGPGRFRVLTGRFIVEVLGTRFIVRQDGVHTLHGRVRVLDLAGRELALVTDGETWQLPSVAAEPPPPASAPPPSERAASERSSVARVNELRARVSPDAAALLEQARAKLAQGEAETTRQLVAQSLEARPSTRERAEASLLDADALRVERRPDDALDAYRRTAERFPSLPEGELAAFTAAEVRRERGTPDEARSTLRAYLARYPSGRFAREAETELRALEPASTER